MSKANNKNKIHASRFIIMHIIFLQSKELILSFFPQFKVDSPIPRRDHMQLRRKMEEMRGNIDELKGTIEKTMEMLQTLATKEDPH